MSNITSKTHRSNLKKAARNLQKKESITYSQALERVTKEQGFKSYHDLTSHRKNINNESNIVNANLGTDGVNDQYAKAVGNRGKQLNPNQKFSLAVGINESARALVFSNIEGRRVGVQVSFKEEYLDKGFLEYIGARRIHSEEKNARNLEAYDRRESLFQYSIIEFLRDEPWQLEEAYCFIAEKLNIMLHGKSDTIWIDNVAHPGTNYHEDKYDIPYCPAIDGY
tara:strand:- start:1015 stop:1686 length:672 start_codon:yes stop_codon:yes gene_type:complete